MATDTSIVRARSPASGYTPIAVIAALVVAALVSVMIGERDAGGPPSSALIAAAYPLVTGQVQNFILIDPAEAASAIAFEDGDGNALGLEDFRGQYVLLNFWATWCGPCKRDMPSLDRLQAELGSKDFHVLALSQDRTGTDDVKDFFTEYELAKLDLYIDASGASSRKFSATGLPFTVLLDPQGQLIGAMLGPAEWDSEEAVTLLSHFAQ